MIGPTARCQKTQKPDKTDTNQDSTPPPPPKPRSREPTISCLEEREGGHEPEIKVPSSDFHSAVSGGLENYNTPVFRLDNKTPYTHVEEAFHEALDILPVLLYLIAPSAQGIGVIMIFQEPIEISFCITPSYKKKCQLVHEDTNLASNDFIFLIISPFLSWVSLSG